MSNQTNNQKGRKIRCQSCRQFKYPHEFMWTVEKGDFYNDCIECYTNWKKRLFAGEFDD
jgi:hypothetical protein